MFSYTPKDGGEPIVFPAADVLWEDVDDVKPVVFLWRLRKMQEPYQTFAFMERAKVDDDMAERALQLDVEERQLMFREWFQAITTPEPESDLPPES
jgi:hypothetical protein